MAYIYIYKCKLQAREPCIDLFKKELKERYYIEKSIHVTRFNIDSFNRIWLQYNNLIE